MAGFDNLQDMSIDEVMEQFDLTQQQIEAVLKFCAQLLKAPPGTEPIPAFLTSASLIPR